MPDVLIRNIQAPVLNRLKRCAKQNRRSLQAELRLILDRAAGPNEVSFDEAVRFADEMRERFRGRVTDDSMDIIRAARGW